MNSEHYVVKRINNIPQCFCGQMATYYTPYDCYACETGDEWLDDYSDCTDYMFDSPRPTKPSQALKWVER